MLKLDQLKITVGDFELKADWTMEAGGIYAVLGPSGAGKSTFFSAIAGFLKPNEGRISFDGGDFENLSPANRPISNVFQSHNLFPRLNIRENVKLGKPDAREADINQIVSNFEIQHVLDHYPHEVSGGQAVRAALARAVLQNNDLWLLDEPFASLGPRLDRELRALISKEFMGNNHRTLLFISHQPQVVQEWADFVIWIDGGLVYSPVQASDFIQNPPVAARKYL